MCSGFFLFLSCHVLVLVHGAYESFEGYVSRFSFGYPLEVVVCCAFGFEPFSFEVYHVFTSVDGSVVVFLFRRRLFGIVLFLFFVCIVFLVFSRLLWCLV